jgi:low temperature requirement protein LtrA
VDGVPDGTEPAVRVSTLELFFDLVFVFTITQLTATLAADLSLRGVLRVALMLGVIWWMYGGYAWLTNAVAPNSVLRRGLLLLGMVGFLTIALAIPRAFTTAGAAFGVGYFLVNLVHSGLFMYSGGRSALHAMFRLAPLNLASACLVLGGGLAPSAWRYGLWAGALGLQIVSPYLFSIGGFSISAAHFVERHGLVVIIALGESVVAIGVGLGGQVLDGRHIALAVLGLALAFTLWWAYFGVGDDIRAEHALDGIADPLARARAALRAYGYAHYAILFGIVALAVGLKKALVHAGGHIDLRQAATLGAGVAVFLIGDLAFRRVLRLGRLRYRIVAVLLAAASIPLGPVSAAGQIGLLVAIVATLLLAEAVT